MTAEMLSLESEDEQAPRKTSQNLTLREARVLVLSWCKPLIPSSCRIEQNSFDLSFILQIPSVFWF